MNYFSLNHSMSDIVSNQRNIIIQGANLALSYRNHEKTFSCRDIKIVVDHFLRLGHTNVIAMLPDFVRTSDYYPAINDNSDSEIHLIPILIPELLVEMEKNNNLVYTPSRYVNGVYNIDEFLRLMLNKAVMENAIIVSNSRWLLWPNSSPRMEENKEWIRHIETSNLLFVEFDGDNIKAYVRFRHLTESEELINFVFFYFKNFVFFWFYIGVFCCYFLLLLLLPLTTILLSCFLIYFKPDFLSVVVKCAFKTDQEIREYNSKYIVVNDKM